MGHFVTHLPHYSWNDPYISAKSAEVDQLWQTHFLAFFQMPPMLLPIEEKTALFQSVQRQIPSMRAIKNHTDEQRGMSIHSVLFSLRGEILMLSRLYLEFDILST